MFDYLAGYQVEAVESIAHFERSATVTDEIQRFVGLIDEIAAQLSGELPTVDAVLEDDRLPVRLTRGPLDFGLPESMLDEPGADWYRTSDAAALTNAVRFETTNFIDGKRTVGEIAGRVTAEFRGVEPMAVSRLIEDLVTVEALDWR